MTHSRGPFTRRNNQGQQPLRVCCHRCVGRSRCPGLGPPSVVRNVRAVIIRYTILLLYSSADATVELELSRAHTTYGSASATSRTRKPTGPGTPRRESQATRGVWYDAHNPTASWRSQGGPTCSRLAYHAPCPMNSGRRRCEPRGALAAVHARTPRIMYVEPRGAARAATLAWARPPIWGGDLVCALTGTAAAAASWTAAGTA